MARTRTNREESATDPGGRVHGIRRSGRLVGSVGKRNPSEKAPQGEASADEEEDSSASGFDCNICLEVAKEPVVTCCGHLFCWPCLYLWLHVHCEFKECPVCKGKVNESSVLPIYGRGSSEASEGRKNAEDGYQGMKIPARPQGTRVEGFRQQLTSSLLRRPESWLLQEVQQMFHAIPASLRAYQMEERRSPPMPPRNVQPIPSVTATSPPQPVTLRNSTLTELHGTSRRRSGPAVTVTVSDELPDPAPSPSQVSTSSTMAMIQGDTAVNDSSLEAEPETGGTSMVLRRRTRSRIYYGGSSAGNQRRRRLN